MPLNLNYLQEVLQNSFPDAEIELVDEKGDGYHLALHIATNQFKNVPLIKRHKLIYEALGSNMEQIHALSISAVTKEG